MPKPKPARKTKPSAAKKRGGARKGAGRKPSKITTIVKKLQPSTAAMILSEIDENKEWLRLLKYGEERVRLDVLKYLTDKRDGKAKQAVEHTGEIKLRNLSDDELAAQYKSLIAEIASGS